MKTGANHGPRYTTRSGQLISCADGDNIGWCAEKVAVDLVTELWRKLFKRKGQSSPVETASMTGIVSVHWQRRIRVDGESFEVLCIQLGR